MNDSLRYKEVFFNFKKKAEESKAKLHDIVKKINTIKDKEKVHSYIE